MQDNPLERFTDRVLETALVIFGFVGMLTPLLLWVTYSKFTFYLVLSVGIVDISAFVLLSWFFNARVKKRGGPAPTAGPRP